MKRLTLVLVALLLTSCVAHAESSGDKAAYASGTFEITTWVETEVAALPDGAKVIHLAATDDFTGDLVGTAQAEEEHFVRADGTRDFAGLIIVTGTLAGRAGTFVIRTTGTFDGDAARSDWQVVPGSGTGGLRGIRGSGTDVAMVGSPKVRYTLRYWFALPFPR
jgi:hypothetical protein